MTFILFFMVKKSAALLALAATLFFLAERSAEAISLSTSSPWTARESACYQSTALIRVPSNNPSYAQDFNVFGNRRDGTCAVSQAFTGQKISAILMDQFGATCSATTELYLNSVSSGNWGKATNACSNITVLDYARVMSPTVPMSGWTVLAVATYNR